MNAKLTKFLAKGALSVATACAIGYMIKLEKRLEDRIDEGAEETTN